MSEASETYLEAPFWRFKARCKPYQPKLAMNSLLPKSPTIRE